MVDLGALESVVSGFDVARDFYLSRFGRAMDDVSWR